MCTVFWDREGILLVEFLPIVETINAEWFRETWRRHHYAGVTQILIEQFGWEQFDQPPYSLDLAPTDYHLLLNLKRDFEERSFGSDNDLKSGVLQWMTSLAASSYEESIEKMVLCNDKCLNNDANYVEK